jgi:ATP-dependent DNA helicase RecG
MTIQELKNLRESEDKVEFKEAKTQYNYDSGHKCLLAYLVALANECGGMFVMGMKDNHPHEVVGSSYFQGSEGQLEQNIYRDLNIRVSSEVLFEDSKRVLILHIPSRPVGKPLYFHNIPLMRIGDGTERMSEDRFRNIINEQEPDFSAAICKDLTIDNLDPDAIAVMKEKYARKQNNERILSQDNFQILKDLELSVNDTLTYAALILLGKKEIIKSHLPQSKIIIEFRNQENSIPFDKRDEFQGPYFLEIEKVWNLLNLRNLDYHYADGPYIFDIPHFNEEVIRESIHNAVAHRNYRQSSEIVVKQFPELIIVSSPGGFPFGVTKENILTVSSTPRNRLLSDVMAKTGLVERSGQGVDKMYILCMEDGKPLPDYSETDDYQVNLKLFGNIDDLLFTKAIREIQSQRDVNDKLGLNELNTLYDIKNLVSKNKLNKITISKLLNDDIIRPIGKTKGLNYQLSPEFFKTPDLDFEKKVLDFLQNNDSAKLEDFENLFNDELNRRQIKYRIEKLVTDKKIKRIGKMKGTKYVLK